MFSRTVTVTGKKFVLNATNAEVIIGTVIEEANKGEIDLNGFGSFWTFVKQEVNATLGLYESELRTASVACNKRLSKGFQCSPCVCDSRNKIVSKALSDVEQVSHNVNFFHLIRITTISDIAICKWRS